MIKLDIGCGKRCKKGYVGVDKIAFPDVIAVNIDYIPLPFLEESVQEIYCNHTLEHIQNLIFVMNEFHRVLIPKGKLEIGVPLVGAYAEDGQFLFGNGAYTDPTHVRYFSQDSFRFLEKGFINNTDIGLKGHFKMIKQEVHREIKPHNMIPGINLILILEKD